MSVENPCFHLFTKLNHRKALRTETTLLHTAVDKNTVYCILFFIAYCFWVSVKHCKNSNIKKPVHHTVHVYSALLIYLLIHYNLLIIKVFRLTVK